MHVASELQAYGTFPEKLSPELQSDEAQWRLSVARPTGAFANATCEGGVPTYGHITGGAEIRRRSAYQICSLMGFVLNKNDGAFMQRWLSQDEIKIVHECLCWGRQPGNNKEFVFFVQECGSVLARGGSA